MKKTEEKRAAIKAKMDAESVSIENAADAIGIPRSTAYRIMAKKKIVRVQPEPSTTESVVLQPEQHSTTESVVLRPEPQVQPTVDLTSRYAWEREKDARQRAENATAGRRRLRSVAEHRRELERRAHFANDLNF